jgi:LPS sulfotransferase NodH
MTGIADIISTVNREAWHAVARMGLLATLDAVLFLLLPKRVALSLIPRLFPKWHCELKEGSMVHKQCPRTRLPDQRPTLQLPDTAVDDHCGLPSVRPGRSMKWGILLPLTSRPALTENGECEDEGVWPRLERNALRLVESIPISRRADTAVHIAIDLRDPVLDNDEARARLRALMSLLGEVDFAPSLPPAYQGAICWIWDLLAKRAVAAGADLFVLLGDDITMHHDDWQADVEQCFAEAASERGMPFGCACVAIRDRAFPNFPTFPVLHRLHLDVFGKLFPQQFFNQHGDPFLFEVYRRWGVSRYTAHADLSNGVGGAGNARYTKAGQNEWRGSTLTKAICQLESWLLSSHTQRPQQIPCIDIIVPTFRCDFAVLELLCSLDCERPASVHTTIVVDRPDAANLDQILELASYQPDRTVRIHVMEKNVGAGNARNAGLWQSFGDYAIFLDDDVTPSVGLVDAYLGAIERIPGAAAYVGMTQLPVPQSLVQQAMAACNICYFYGVAKEQKTPPWGITANLCVPSRTSNVSFSKRYPKTGGGEDVDFCIRLQQESHQTCVAVPCALVMHPYWDKPFNQVFGWASGDVLCLDALPHSTFRAPPNWAEVALACVCTGRPELAVVATALEAALLAPRFFQKAQTGNKIIVSAIATLPPMLQDMRRLISKLMRLRLTQLCLHFDWMNGAGHHASEKSLSISGKGIAFLLAKAAIDGQGTTSSTAGICLVVYYILWCIGQVDLHVLPKVLRVPRNLKSELNLGTAAVPFVIFGFQRTGSNLLCSYLGNHPQVAMHYELFNDKAVYAHDGQHTTGADIKDRDSDPASFLTKMLTVEKRSEPLGGGQPTCVGFKVFPEHICRSKASRCLFENLLSDTRVRKIVLRRENRLAVCVSALRSSVTGEYIKKNLDDVKVKIAPHELQTFIDHYDNYYNYIGERLAGQHGTWLDVTYEDLVRDPSKTTRRIYKLLSVPAAAPASPIRKQTTTGLRNAVDNFDELRDAFAGTERACDFDED